MYHYLEEIKTKYPKIANDVEAMAKRLRELSPDTANPIHKGMEAIASTMVEEKEDMLDELKDHYNEAIKKIEHRVGCCDFDHEDLRGILEYTLKHGDDADIACVLVSTMDAEIYRAMIHHWN